MNNIGKNILQSAILLICITFTACNVDIPTYKVQVSGIVADTKGNPVSNASIKVLDRQKDENSMFGNATMAYIDRMVGTTTTDERGHYSLSITTEGLYFNVSTVYREQNWDSCFAQSGYARCECASGKSDYVVDMTAKTEIEYYTGSIWEEAVEASPLAINLSDSIHIHLKDGGTIMSAGIWFDYPYETQEGGVTVTHHEFKSGYNMYYHVDGGAFSMEAGLTDYDLIFKMDTTAESRCSIPYCERCYLKVVSLKNNIDQYSYFIPLILF